MTKIEDYPSSPDDGPIEAGLCERQRGHVDYYPSSPDDGPIEASRRCKSSRCHNNDYPSSPDDGPIEAYGACYDKGGAYWLSVVPGRRPH